MKSQKENDTPKQKLVDSLAETRLMVIQENDRSASSTPSYVYVYNK